MVKIYEVTLGGKNYPLGYRVVTQDMKSLGLRNNPNIIQYPIREWLVLPQEKVIEGISDEGGIWAARTPGVARRYV